MKNPVGRKSNRAKSQLYCVFYHPDYTVGA